MNDMPMGDENSGGNVSLAEGAAQNGAQEDGAMNFPSDDAMNPMNQDFDGSAREGSQAASLSELSSGDSLSESSGAAEGQPSSFAQLFPGAGSLMHAMGGGIMLF